MEIPKKINAFLLCPVCIPPGQGEPPSSHVEVGVTDEGILVRCRVHDSVIAYITDLKAFVEERKTHRT